MSILRPEKKASEEKRVRRCYDYTCHACKTQQKDVIGLYVTDGEGNILRELEAVVCRRCGNGMTRDLVTSVRSMRVNMVKQLKHDHKTHKKIMTKHNKFWKERGYEEEFGPKDFRNTRDEY